MIYLPNTDLGERGPEITAFKSNQSEKAFFDFREENIVFRVCGFGMESGGEVVF